LVIFVPVIFGIAHFTAVIMLKVFELTGIFLVFSSRKMSLDDSPPHVRQRIEESVADRHLRMEKQQVLPKRNLIRVDLRYPILLTIGQMIQENQWEYPYNYACLAFPILVREFFGHMISLG
jgi:hypothetical protein